MPRSTAKSRIFTWKPDADDWIPLFQQDRFASRAAA